MSSTRTEPSYATLSLPFALPTYLVERKALYLDITRSKGSKVARQCGANPAKLVLDRSLDLRPPLVARREFVARVVGERIQPRADRAVGIAELPENRVHPPLQCGEFVEAHLMEIGRAHV